MRENAHTARNEAKSTRRWSVVLLAALVAALQACAGLGFYTAPTVSLDARESAPAAEILSLAAEQLQARGLRLLRSDPQHGVLVAVSPARGTSGLRSRDRWVFEVSGTELRVELHPELRTATGWEPVVELCESYAYARENLLLAQVQAALRSGRGAGGSRFQ